MSMAVPPKRKDGHDPYGVRYVPRGLCPLCRAPERVGGMRAGSYIPFECGTSARPAGGCRDGGVSYRPNDISVGTLCFNYLQTNHDEELQCDTTSSKT